MFQNLEFHDVIFGIGFLVSLVIIGALAILARAIPTELWTLVGTLAGINLGVQIPAPAQRALLARQADQMTALVTSVTQQRTPPL